MSSPAHALFVVMGVSGCGKSTVGAALAERLGVPFVDADDMHPPENIEKMSNGVPLTDADRAPWLVAIGELLAQSRESGMIIACSALKTAYRDALRALAPDVGFLHLRVSRNTLEARMTARRDHFMPPSMLQTQLDTLEPLSPSEHGATIDAELSLDGILDESERVLRV